MSFEFFVLALYLVEQFADFVFIELALLGHVDFIPWVFDVIAKFAEFRAEALSHGESNHARHVPCVTVAPTIPLDYGFYLPCPKVEH